jgi:cysteinyl-tRNA synthetase
MFGNLFKSGSTSPARTIHLYNTATRSLEPFEPHSSPVLMYSCGPTVYDFVTIGNLRSFIMADVVKRVLLHNGYLVKHTINLTDFGHLSDDGDAGEDKMMKGLAREGMEINLQAMRDLSERYILAFQDDIEELRILPPDTWARASDYVKAQIKLIQTLDTKGYVYETSDGVYFDISKFPTYGKLGNINLEEIKSGARVEANPEKRHPADFAVWKKSDLGWQSRYGAGFPGWHIECSAMAMRTLGKSIDIHTGGEDLAYTHHNAEIAQCEAATGKPFTKYWLHNAFITIDNTKISKSLGNSVTLRHLLDRGFTGDDYRYWLMTAHYRSPVNFTWEALKAAKQALYRLKRHMYEDYKQVSGRPDATYLEQFDERLADDFDTPSAVALMWEVVKDKKLDNKTKCGTLLAMDGVLDIGLSDDLEQGARALGVISQSEIPDEIQAMINERETARLARDFSTADLLRQKIADAGYALEDTPHGPKVSKSL